MTTEPTTTMQTQPPPPATASVPPSPPAMQYRLRRSRRCGLYSCCHCVSKDSKYCCEAHADIARTLADIPLPYILVDGCAQDHDMISTTAVLNKSEGIHVGVGTIDGDEVFRTVPWQFEFVGVEPFLFLEKETQRSYTFFGDREPSFTAIDFNACRYLWTRKSYHRYTLEGTEIRSSTSYFYLTSEGNEEAAEYAKRWTLDEHCDPKGGKSLFTFHYIRKPSDLFSSKKGATDAESSVYLSETPSQSTGDSSETTGDSTETTGDATESSGDAAASSGRRLLPGRAGQQKTKGVFCFCHCCCFHRSKTNPNPVYRSPLLLLVIVKQKCLGRLNL
uniref:Uncharacterized protein n=1 Tax=Noccaea caerulescens TaxID=107243 RepID=A0A1J3JBT5_NOCCA